METYSTVPISGKKIDKREIYLAYVFFLPKFVTTSSGNYSYDLKWIENIKIGNSKSLSQIGNIIVYNYNMQSKKCHIENRPMLPPNSSQLKASEMKHHQGLSQRTCHFGNHGFLFWFPHLPDKICQNFQAIQPALFAAPWCYSNQVFWRHTHALPGRLPTSIPTETSV